MNALNFYAEKPPFMNISLHKDVTKRQLQQHMSQKSSAPILNAEGGSSLARQQRMLLCKQLAWLTITEKSVSVMQKLSKQERYSHDQHRYDKG